MRYLKPIVPALKLQVSKLKKLDHWDEFRSLWLYKGIVNIVTAERNAQESKK